MHQNKALTVSLNKRLALTRAQRGNGVEVPLAPPTANLSNLVSKSTWTLIARITHDQTKTMTCVPPSRAADMRKLYLRNHRAAPRKLSA